MTGGPDAQPDLEPGVETILDPVASTPDAQASHRLLSGGTWNAVAQLAPVVVNLVLTPYVIHGLGIARFGLYILVTSIADFLGTFDGGVYTSSQRYFAVYAGRNDRGATSRLFFTLCVGVVLVGTAMIAILVGLAPVILSLFHVPAGLQEEGQTLLRLLGFVIALAVLRGVFAALLNARSKFAFSSLTTVGQYVVYSVGIVLTVRHHEGLRGVGYTLLAMTVLSTLSLALASVRYVSPRLMRPMPRAELVDYLRYAGNSQVAGLSDLINLQSDSIFIGGFLSVGSVTFYSSGRNFASQMRSLPWNAITPAAALLGRTYGEGGTAATLERFRELQRVWVQACTGWIAVGAAAAWFGVTRWLGSGFELSGTVAVILLVGYLFRLWAGMLTVYCQAVGHPELEARYGFVSVAVNLAFTLSLIMPFGVVGVVVATAAGQAVGSAYLLRLTRRRLSADVPSFLSDVPWLAGLLAALVTAVLELLARPVVPEGPLGLLAAGLVAVPGLVVFALVLLGPSQVVGYARRLPALGRR